MSSGLGFKHQNWSDFLLFKLHLRLHPHMRLFWAFSCLPGLLYRPDHCFPHSKDPWSEQEETHTGLWTQLGLAMVPSQGAKSDPWFSACRWSARGTREFFDFPSLNCLPVLQATFPTGEVLNLIDVSEERWRRQKNI